MDDNIQESWMDIDKVICRADVYRSLKNNSSEIKSGNIINENQNTKISFIL